MNFWLLMLYAFYVNNPNNCLKYVEGTETDFRCAIFSIEKWKWTNSRLSHMWMLLFFFRLLCILFYYILLAVESKLSEEEKSKHVYIVTVYHLLLQLLIFSVSTSIERKLIVWNGWWAAMEESAESWERDREEESARAIG